MQEAVDAVWPFTHELFEHMPNDLHPSGLHGLWAERVTDVLHTATLVVPQDDWMPTGGRSGLHTEAFGHLLAEMQSLHRAHPGARW